MSRLVRDLTVGTLRTSLMTVGAFLAAYGVISLLIGADRPSIGLAPFAGMLVFGLLLSLPFALQLVLGAILGRIAYNRFAIALLPSESLRTWILLILVAGLGLLMIWLWQSAQGLDDIAAELSSALYIAGAIGGGTAGYYGARSGGRG